MAGGGDSVNEIKARLPMLDIAEFQQTDTVFVVHGRDLKMRDAFFDLLNAFDLHPLEWSEALALTQEPNPFINDVLDAAFEVAAAVLVLLTPDDTACLHEKFWPGAADYEKTPTGQARPNVLFEAGMAMGRDAKRTILVQVGDLRPFSDIAGRHILHFDGSIPRRLDLARRLGAAGCEPNTAGDHWQRAGDFDLPAERDQLSTPAAPEQQQELFNVHLRHSPTPGRGYLVIENRGETALSDVVAQFDDSAGFLFLPQTQPLKYLVPGQRAALPVISVGATPPTATFIVELRAKRGVNDIVVLSCPVQWEL